MSDISKLQKGLQAYYEQGYTYDYTEAGVFIIGDLSKIGLTEEEFLMCLRYDELYGELHENDTVIAGCDCGCGGDSIDWEQEDDRCESILEAMQEIENVLGKQDYLG